MTTNGAPVLPEWAVKMLENAGDELCQPEWNNGSSDDSHRSNNGWKGLDYMHDRVNSPVYIYNYRVAYNTSGGIIDTKLTAAVYFSDRAESHQGFIHGGAMCSCMDDIIGWAAFCATGQAWSGYTVQVNTSLCKPIPVGAILVLRGSIYKVEKQRKVYVQAELLDKTNGDEEIVHAKGDGIVILNKGVLSEDGSRKESSLNIIKRT